MGEVNLRRRHDMRGRFDLLVTDVDNTLYDWVAIWYATFSTLLSEVSRISSISEDRLKAEIRTIHQREGTAEYTWLLQGMPSLELDPNVDVMESRFAPAIIASKAARKAEMRLYPHVAESLRRIRSAGIPVVSYTESGAFQTAQRFRWTGLDGLIDTLFSTADHSKPTGLDVDAIRSKPAEDYGLKATKHSLTPPGHFKPDPVILSRIVAEFSAAAGRVAYVGDSIPKDIAMAQALGVADFHAGYGVAQNKPEYDLLRQVSHWSDLDVAREREILAAPPAVPTVVLNSFSEILDHLGV